MSTYWSPSGAEVSVAAGASATFTNKVEGLARVVNTTTSITMVGLATAAATAGEFVFSTVQGLGVFFIAFGSPVVKVAATVNPVLIQPGYAQK